MVLSLRFFHGTFHQEGLHAAGVLSDTVGGGYRRGADPRIAERSGGAVHRGRERAEGSEAAPAADWTFPRTSWGAPDLQGVWDYRTMTPLERPRELAGKATLTAEEAAAYEQRQNELLDDYDRSPSVHAKWWLDYGRALTGDRRTSLVVDPPDGRLPAVTEDARQRAAARSERRRQYGADAAEYRGLTERCITFGMPRLPGAYNNNYQIVVVVGSARLKCPGLLE